MSLLQALQIFNLFPRNPNEVERLITRFNGDHVYDDISIKSHHTVDSSLERIRLYYEDFGSFDRRVNIGNDEDTDTRFYEHHFSFYKYDDDDPDKEESYIKEEASKEEAKLICSVLVPYIYSGGKNIKKVPLIIHTWPEATRKILSGS